MNILVNGHDMDVRPTINVAELMDQLVANGIARPIGTAVAINDRLVTRSEWPVTLVRPDDEVTVISAAFGG